MKTTLKTATAAIVSAFNDRTRSAVTLWNKLHDAWYLAKAEGVSPLDFRESVLAEFDKSPLAMVKETTTERGIASAHAKARNSLSSYLTQAMPQVDPDVSWKVRATGAGRKPTFNAAQIKMMREALAGCGLPQDKFAAALKKLGISPLA